MPLKPTKHWTDDIRAVTDSEEFQTCKIQVIDPNLVIPGEYNWETGEREGEDMSEAILYEGRARFIPVRASVFEGGEGQSNAMFIRAGRIQIPHSENAVRLSTASYVKFSEAPRNPSLLSRTARVSDDFQGSSIATRTFNVMLDADTKVP